MTKKQDLFHFRTSFLLKFLVIIGCSLMVLSPQTYAQENEKNTFTVHLRDGDSIRLTARLFIAGSRLIYANDLKSKFVVGKNQEGHKTEIPKELVRSVVLPNNYEFIPLRKDKDLLFGRFVTEGEIRIFEVYQLDWEPPTMASSSVSGDLVFIGPPLLGHKYNVVVVDRYQYRDQELTPFKRNLKRVKELAENCPELQERLRVFNSLNTSAETMSNLKFYNQVCGNAPAPALEAARVMLFRRKAGQSKEPVTVTLAGKTYSLSGNQKLEVTLENPAKAEVCTVAGNHCITVTFSPDRRNYLELSLPKNETKATVEYVNSSYGSDKAKWMKEVQ